MVESRKKTITEGDTATLLQRYDATTILRLLQEMAYYSDIKFDWSELVKKTTTGITNAREYQLLWRHLSYRDPLLHVEDDAQPLDDDSDIEFELEASPAVTHEASVEAIAHVKVMAASYVPSESDLIDDSTVEAPLTINIPYSLPEGTQEPSESPWSSRGMNITFPVCLQKATSTEGMNGNGSASSSMPFRRKRKKWSAEEDEELIAAVKRCGEGNWAHIVKGDFKGERTASQLSQRWALIRRRCDTSTFVSQSGLQQTEAQIAVNHALSLALGNRPPSKKLAVGSTMISASTPLASASKIISNQRVFAASVPATVLPPKPTAETVTCKTDGGQKEQARGDGASSSVAIRPNKMTSTNSEIIRGKQATQAQSPNLLPRKIPVAQTAVLGATNQNLVDKPSDKTAVPSISVAGLHSKAKCEVNNNFGSVIKVSNVCGKPPEVATVAGTGQGV